MAEQLEKTKAKLRKILRTATTISHTDFNNKHMEVSAGTFYRARKEVLIELETGEPPKPNGKTKPNGDLATTVRSTLVPIMNKMGIEELTISRNSDGVAKMEYILAPITKEVKL